MPAKPKICFTRRTKTLNHPVLVTKNTYTTTLASENIFVEWRFYYSIGAMLSQMWNGQLENSIFGRCTARSALEVPPFETHRIAIGTMKFVGFGLLVTRPLHVCFRHYGPTGSIFLPYEWFFLFFLVRPLTSWCLRSGVLYVMRRFIRCTYALNELSLSRSFALFLFEENRTSTDLRFVRVSFSVEIFPL